MRDIDICLGLIGALLLCACNDHLSEPQPVPKPIAFQEVDSGKYDCFYIPDSGTTVICSESLWVSYWQQYWLCTSDGRTKTPPPGVDFSRDIVLAVHYGEGYSGCRNRVDVIRNIYLMKDTIHVAIDRLPSPGVCLAWIRPLQMVTIPQSTHPVLFERYIQQ